MQYALSECNATQESNFVTFSGPCVACGERQKVKVTLSELKAYKNGSLIQNALRRLTSPEREFLISGFCGHCWDK